MDAEDFKKYLIQNGFSQIKRETFSNIFCDKLSISVTADFDKYKNQKSIFFIVGCEGRFTETLLKLEEIEKLLNQNIAIVIMLMSKFKDTFKTDFEKIETPEE